MSDTNGKQFNPTVTAFFDAPKFANKAFNGEENNAFLSAAIDEKALGVLKNVKAGEKLLLRRTTKLNKNGGSTFYLEVIAPQAGTFKAKTATETIEDGI